MKDTSLFISAVDTAVYRHPVVVKFETPFYMTIYRSLTSEMVRTIRYADEEIVVCVFKKKTDMQLIKSLVEVIEKYVTNWNFV